MFVLGYFLESLASVVDGLLWFYMIVIIARAVLSWVNPDPRNAIVQFLEAATWPLLYQIRRYLPLVYGGIDLSPLVAILGVELVRHTLVPSLRHVAFLLSSPV
jgi:YggT family protein